MWSPFKLVSGNSTLTHETLFLIPFSSIVQDVLYSYNGTPEISIAALENGKAHTVTCEVENTGSTAGHATVQLYIQGVSGTIVRRVRELKAFEKVYLQPGEKKTVELKLDCDALSIWNRKMQFAPEESKVELYVEESGSKVWNGELKITK